MRITRLSIRNFRTLENVELQFSHSYTAICGANDSGKTNVIRAIRALMSEDSQFEYGGIRRTDVKFKGDYPKWKSADDAGCAIELNLSLVISSGGDAGLYQSVVKQLELSDAKPEIAIEFAIKYVADQPSPSVIVTCEGKTFQDIPAQEVLKRLQSSKCVVFHNSTQTDPRYGWGPHLEGTIRAWTPEHDEIISAMNTSVARGMKKLSKTHQQEIEQLIGRLESKYKVGLSMPEFDFSDIPFSVTLGQSKFDVPLNDWGSGTRNRTMILLAMFRAKQLSVSEASASKVTPIIVLEEPESFLHPAAQAEFGRVLQDMAQEFGVQVIVTTHSPYLLSMVQPDANVLLQRHVHYKNLQETRLVDTSGESWMAPFSLALGMNSEIFEPWKKLLFSSSESIVLVEGKTDKGYLELLRQDVHGARKLAFDGEVVDYEGKGAICNTVLLRFVKNKYKRLFVTFDMDAEKDVRKTLDSLNLERGKHFAALGVDAPGKRAIEGLVPDHIRNQVYQANPGLVTQTMSDNKDEKESATNKLKDLLFDAFKGNAKPGTDDYRLFYQAAAVISKALS
jgi:putative ATP-dependent endonuclease of the OLD family